MKTRTRIRTTVVTGLLALGLVAGCNLSYSPLVSVFPVTRGGKVQYNVVAEDGTVFEVGVKDTPDHHLGFRLNKPIVDAVARPVGAGYWLVGGDGGVFALGGAPYKGNALGQDIVGMAPTPSGNGYWLVGSDGHVFNRGDAAHYHDLITDHIVPNQPVVGMAATPTGHGYWLVARDGGIFSFGDAHYHGNARQSDHPIVGMAAAAGGYWIVAEDGGVFTFNQQFHGSLGNNPPDNRVRHITVAPDGQGYWLLEEHGKVHAFGSAKHYDPDVVFLPSGPPGQFVFPISDANSFDEERTDRGQDFVTDDGAPLLAMADGTVAEVRNDPGGFGPCMVIIEMDQPYDIYPYLFYGHGKPNGNHCYVSVGQRVVKGQPVGIAGGTGSASTPGAAEIGFLPGNRDVETPLDCTHQTRSGIFMHNLLHQLKPNRVGATPIRSCG